MDIKKILVLESDETAFETYKEYLGSEFSLILARTNRDARFKTDNDTFNLIVAEISLQDGSATDTILRFREFGQNKTTPILFITDFGESVLDQFSKFKSIFYLKKMPTSIDLMSKVKEILSSIKKEATIDVKIINPIITGTITTLQTMTGIIPEPQKFYLKQKSEVSGDISGVVGITSSTYNGSIALSFNETLFLKVVSKMIGEECTKIDEGTKDAVAELMNIIFGQAKKTLSEQGYAFEKAIPSIITGKNHIIDFQSTLPVVVIPFKTDLGIFRVEVCASEKKNKN